MLKKKSPFFLRLLRFRVEYIQKHMINLVKA